MPIEFKPYLLLALHELDHFSVPGVGTFVRRREKARFDPETGQLYPPLEVTELKRGDEMLDAFVGFLEAKTGKPRGEAENLAREIGTTTIQFIQSLVDIELEGFGVLKKGAYNLPAFEPTESDSAFESLGLPVATVGKLEAVATPPPTKPAATKPAALPKRETKQPVAKPETTAPTPAGPKEPTPSKPQADAPAKPDKPTLQPRKSPLPPRKPVQRKKRSPLRLVLVLLLAGVLGAGAVYTALNWTKVKGMVLGTGTAENTGTAAETGPTDPAEPAPDRPTAPADTTPQAPPAGAKKPTAFPGSE